MLIPLSSQALPTGKSLSELLPAILDRIITGKYSKRIVLMVIRARYRKHLAVHRSDDTRMEIPRTKPCNELPDENSPIINLVIFDRSITGENSKRIKLVLSGFRKRGRRNSVASDFFLGFFPFYSDFSVFFRFFRFFPFSSVFFRFFFRFLPF